MQNRLIISKGFRPSVEPTPDVTPELTPAMLLTQKIPELVDPSRGMRYREIKLREGRSKDEAIISQGELIEELTRQLKDQEQRAAHSVIDESFRAAYRQNIETLKQALLEANSTLDMSQSKGTGISSFFSNFFSFFSGNTGQKQTTSAAAAADSGHAP